MPDFTRLPILLRPSRAKQILLLAVCLAFTAIGVMMVRDGERMGYCCGGVFGLGVCVAVANMLPGAAYLRLDEGGFTFCSLFRAHTVPWSAVAEFGVFTIRRNQMVGWNYVSPYEKPSRLRGVNRGLCGFDAGLPNIYGMKAVELAELMESGRVRCGAGTGSGQVLVNGQVRLEA